MARNARIEYPGAVYYISINAAPNVKAFKDNIDKRRFLRILETAASRYNLVVHAYVIMEDGYRLVVETPLGNLSKTMQYINSHYMAYANTRRSDSGRIFSGRYRSVLIEKNKYLLKLCRHLHQEPVARGIVARAGNYAWSSHNAYTMGKFKEFEPRTKDALSNFDGFKQRQRRKFEKFVDSGAIAEWRELEKKLSHSRTLGEINEEHIKKAVPKKAASTVSHDLIIEKTAEYFKTTPNMIVDNKIKPNPPRNMAIYLCRNGIDAPLEDLGRVFGVCPSCICNTAKRVDAQLRMGSELTLAVEAIKNDLAIEMTAE